MTNILLTRIALDQAFVTLVFQVEALKGMLQLQAGATADPTWKVSLITVTYKSFLISIKHTI